MHAAQLTVAAKSSGRWRLTWDFHHAVCDGYGAGRLIAECLKAYHGRRLPREVAEANADRPSAAPPAPAAPDLRHLGMTIRGRNVRLQQLGGLPASIDRAQVKHWRLGNNDSDRLRQAVRAGGATLNDLSVAVAFEAIAAGCSARPTDRIMLLNPTQTRSWSGRRRTENHLGLVLPRRRVEELGDLGRTFASVAEQMRDVRRHGYDRDAPAGISSLVEVPLAMTLMERLGWFTPTAAVTCLSAFNLHRQGGFEKPSGHRQERLAIDSNDPTSSLRPEPMTVVGPLQAGGALSVAVWDDGLQVAASFRYNTAKLNTTIDHVIDRWNHHFEQLCRGVWSLQP